MVCIHFCILYIPSTLQNTIRNRENNGLCYDNACSCSLIKSQQSQISHICEIILDFRHFLDKLISEKLHSMYI